MGLFVVLVLFVLFILLTKICFFFLTPQTKRLSVPPPLSSSPSSSSSSSSCLVTGGCGFLGRNLVKELSKKGEYSHIRIVDISPKPHPLLLSLPNVEYFQIDLVKACEQNSENEKKLKEAISGVDAIFHLAGLVRLDRQYNLLFNLHVAATANLINIGTSGGASRFVHTSSVALMDDMSTNHSDANESTPFPSSFASYYAETKARGEEVVRSHCKFMKYAILRPAPIYGREDPLLISPLLAGEIPFLVKGPTRCWVYVDNIVQAQILADKYLKGKENKEEEEEKTKNIFFITDEGNRTGQELVGTLFSHIPSRSVPPSLPSFGLHFLSFLVETIGWLTSWKFGRFKFFQVTFSALVHIESESWFSVAKAKRILGYQPKSTEEALKEIAEGFVREKERGKKE